MSSLPKLLALDRAENSVPRAERATMWRYLAYQWASGASLLFFTVAVGTAPGANVPGLLAIVVMTYACAGLMLLRGPQLPLIALQLVILLGNALISALIYLSAERGSFYAIFYVWLNVYAFYFLSPRSAAIHTPLTLSGYALVLVAMEGGSFPFSPWLMTAGTLVFVGAMVGSLRSRIRHLVGELHDAARRDSLTGLLNRRGFEELIERESDRARRSDRPFTIAVGDLDLFKRLNDGLGHEAGDGALKRVATILSQSMRRIDTAVRMGGEEFALVLPDTDRHGGYVLAERIRTQLRDAFADEPLPITISFGIAAFPQDGGMPDEVLRAADGALYAAKRLGRDRTVIYSSDLSHSLAEDEFRRTSSREANLATVLALAKALDTRDTGTALHSQTVGRYAAGIAVELGLPPDRVERVRLAGIAHDVGKIVVPDAILQKPGPLDEDEWALIRQHPEHGVRLLANPELADIRSWVLAHHERPDGDGYPQGLFAGEIPLEAQIIAIADAYEAMTSARPYRAALDPVVAQDELRRGAGTQFDRRVVDAFLCVLGRHQQLDAVTST